MIQEKIESLIEQIEQTQEQVDYSEALELEALRTAAEALKERAHYISGTILSSGQIRYNKRYRAYMLGKYIITHNSLICYKTIYSDVLHIGRAMIDGSGELYIIGGKSIMWISKDPAEGDGEDIEAQIRQTGAELTIDEAIRQGILDRHNLEGLYRVRGESVHAA